MSQQTIDQYICQNGHRLNITLVNDCVPTEFLKPIGPSGKDAIACPECDGRMGFSSQIKFTKSDNARQTQSACESICEPSTSSKCSCQCGGSNHGIRA